MHPDEELRIRNLSMEDSLKTVKQQFLSSVALKEINLNVSINSSGFKDHIFAFLILGNFQKPGLGDSGAID